MRCKDLRSIAHPDLSIAVGIAFLFILGKALLSRASISLSTLLTDYIFDISESRLGSHAFASNQQGDLISW
jgi:hypothetical protein